MSPDSVQEHMAVMRERHQRATKAERGWLSDEFRVVAAMHWKSAIPPSPLGISNL